MTAPEAENNPFHQAARKGDLAACQQCLAAGMAIDWVDPTGKTPLLQAAFGRQWPLVEWLLEQGASPFAQARQGITVLHLAASAGELSLCEKLLMKGAKVEAMTHLGNTPLLLAVFAGEAKICELLLEKGAQVNHRGVAAWTPLLIAALLGAAAVMEVLLEKGADPNVAHLSGLTPLHGAVLKNSPDCCLLLLRYGALINAPDGQGFSPLFNTIPSFATLHQLLRQQGAEKITGRGKPQFRTELLRELEAFSRILREKQPVDTCLPGKQPALLLEAMQKRVLTCLLLLEQGAPVNIRNSKESTPLHGAAHQNHAGMCRFLLDQGADLEAVNQWGRTPLHMAIQSEPEIDLGNLIRGGFSELQIDHKHLAACRLLLDKGAAINAQDQDGHTPLHLAYFVDNDRLVELLLERGANPKTRNRAGFIPAKMERKGFFRRHSFYLPYRSNGSNSRKEDWLDNLASPCLL